jgi:hypothetical protein
MGKSLKILVLNFRLARHGECLQSQPLRRQRLGELRFEVSQGKNLARPPHLNNNKRAEHDDIWLSS